MEVEATRQTITVNKLVSTKKETIIIEGETIVPDVKPDILNTIDTAGNVCIYKKETLDGKVRFDGCINLNIVYLADSDSDSVRGLTTTLDFTQMIDVDNCMNGMSLKSNISIKNIDCKSKIGQPGGIINPSIKEPILACLKAFITYDFYFDKLGILSTYAYIKNSNIKSHNYAKSL